MVATLNNGGGFYSPELYFHEARKQGAKIELPCVNRSELLNIINDDTVFIGFYILNSLESNTSEIILTERKRNGLFRNLNDFVNRVPVTLEQLIILIRSGAFRFTGKSKKELLWDAHYLLGHSKKTVPENTLFETKTRHFKLPELWNHELEDTFDQIELLGFTLNSPFKLLIQKPSSEIIASQLPSLLGKNIEIAAYLIHYKPTPTDRKSVV